MTDGASGGMMARIRGILLQPRAEWAKIDPEPATVGGIMMGWVVPLAAIGPVASVIGGLAFSRTVSYATLTVGPPPVGYILGSAVLGYLMTLIGVYVAALVINALAPSFGGQQDPVQAMKVAAYGSTAGFLAGIFSILPGLGVLAILGLYNLYLIYTGLPLLMKSPQDKAVTYVVITIVVMVLIYIVVGAVVGALTWSMLPRPAIVVS